MTRVLVDTSAYTAFRRGDPAVVAVLRQADVIVLSPVVLGELRAGFAAGSRREQNETDLRSFLDSPRVQVVPVDEDTAVYYAAIWAHLRQAGTPIPANDLWIAATAMQHGLQLLTTDAHYTRVPQVVLAGR